MHIYKELSFLGDKPALDNFKKIAPMLASGDWKCSNTDRMSDYISYEYVGDKVDSAGVYIYYGKDSWREGYIRVNNIVPTRKNQLTIEEYNLVLDLFYEQVIEPNLSVLTGIKVIGPETDVFDPLKYISKEALDKLKLFCNCANKMTGSLHPSDEERWFDFICQTVEDRETFDYNTIYRFLMDEDYWGDRERNYIGAMGQYAWDEEHASELASEYDSYVRVLQFYNDWKRLKKYGED